jgi:hypothetical protein
VAIYIENQLSNRLANSCFPAKIHVLNCIGRGRGRGSLILQPIEISKFEFWREAVVDKPYRAPDELKTWRK